MAGANIAKAGAAGCGAYGVETNTMEEPYHDPGLRLDLATALADLPAEQRAAVMLCLGQDFSHAEAAEALDLPLGTVKSHIARREKLIAILDDSHG